MNYIDCIKQELNVKEVVFLENSDTTKVSLKPNFKTLGKKAGNKMNSLKEVIQSWGEKELQLLNISSINVNDIEITLDDVVVTQELLCGRSGNMVWATQGNISVGLDITLTSELIYESYCNELASIIQSLRKERKLHTIAKIDIFWYTESEELQSAVNLGSDSLKERCLINCFTFSEILIGQEFNIEDFKIIIDMK